MLELIHTSDGSHTIRHIGLNETYHSTHGAIQESNYIYIEHGLHYFIDQFQSRSIKILEVGFGTGLNALLTLLDERTLGVKKMYHTVEAYPLPDDIIKKLNYPDHLPYNSANQDFLQLHKAAWDEDVKLSNDFTLRKIHADVCSLRLEENFYDLVYFDAFAPKIQPEVWAKTVLANVIGVMSNKGVMVTYCASGQFKRDLKALNISVEVMPGPPGKREMVRAYQLGK